ncbi:hypothetical protein TIFTF001_052268 [Ficus carica]|uniref:Uncharacterized protein n=1 Tax=Ficus carica TaxID=3494 RepID=A0AA88JIM0_FICCA|nr:hypothetical protein TIFTF001_052268 [Ficus carica]
MLSQNCDNDRNRATNGLLAYKPRTRNCVIIKSSVFQLREELERSKETRKLREDAISLPSNSSNNKKNKLDFRRIGDENRVLARSGRAQPSRGQPSRGQPSRGQPARDQPARGQHRAASSARPTRARGRTLSGAFSRAEARHLKLPRTKRKRTQKKGGQRGDKEGE